MKLLLASAAVALQMAAGTAGPAAQPAYLRYQRAVEVPAGVSGTACATLDATVFAHAASASADDLRIFDGNSKEVPFVMTENAPQPDAAVPAMVQNLGTRGDAVVFDLAMPRRAYSEIDLRLDAKNFVAVAEVSGTASDGAVTKLGTFTIFDMSAQQLSRSTALPLAEATLPVLHVSLRFTTLEGRPLRLPPSVVQGADIPPSRDAQALYTTIASTSALQQQDGSTVATLTVPAHVPVERARVVLDPAYTGNFFRMVTIADGTNSPQNEQVTGSLSRYRSDATVLPGAPPIDSEHLAVDAVMAANLREAATIRVSIANGNDVPLPIRAVVLEMRERRVCFQATAGKTYMMRYGDAALSAPVYDYARLFDASHSAATATLGPESVNAQFRERSDTRPYTERHPELIWIVLVAVVAVLGATAVSSAKHPPKPQGAERADDASKDEA